MPQSSSDTRSASSAPPALAVGPALDYAAALTEAADRTICIRARRVYDLPRTDVFAAWTRRHAWESWLRLRARSRVLLTPTRGGAFRLELAEGPTIHVITGTFKELVTPNFLALTWWHSEKSDSGSLIEVGLRDLTGATELTFVHSQIDRREAAWLMRLWAMALDRLDDYLAEGIALAGERDVTSSLVASSDHVLRPRRSTARYAQSA